MTHSKQCNKITIKAVEGKDGTMFATICRDDNKKMSKAVSSGK